MFGQERSRTGAEKDLLAYGCVYKIRPKVIHVTVSKYCRVGFFCTVMLAIQLLTVSLENSNLCSASLLQNCSEWSSEMFHSEFGSDMFMWVRK